eukprot:CAMPEP_0197258904 /NCGR_PEP_ID=MMETSP1429-20130617/83242_1 /TAXON_ID=49237 /ORGANISM="Chaetoceros  sp., Strain UNC1202" /LENGTH=155 /DNA_ID=CAMNT_0042723093 /DNA_START=27 /DNA_END=494 /DNA_ORIENTATION=-
MTVGALLVAIPFTPPRLETFCYTWWRLNSNMMVTVAGCWTMWRLSFELRHVHASLLHWGVVLRLGGRINSGPDIEHVVTANEDFSQLACELSVNVLFGFEKLQVHVGIGRGEFALVLLAPLEFHPHRFSCEFFEEGLWVDNQMAHCSIPYELTES